MTELFNKTSKTNCINTQFIWKFLTTSYYFNVWHSLTPDLPVLDSFELNNEYNLSLGKNLPGFNQKLKVLNMVEPDQFEFSLYSPMFFIPDTEENRIIVSIKVVTHQKYSEITFTGKTNHTPSKMYEDFVTKTLANDLRSIIKNLDEGYLEHQATKTN